MILDDKITIMDTVDRRGTEGWLANLKETLGDKKPYYVVVSHLEPDHAGNLKTLLDLYPDIKVIGNPKTFTMIAQFFDVDLSDDRKVVVGEGDTVNLGTHTLQFFMAPLVHWPEVMVAYEQSEKILFSADGFGKFGALDADESWEDEARRYFINIVGKYGVQVQNLLKKAATLDIQMICPLHGPILKENLGYYIGKYLTWSSYEPEEKGVVIACASIHGNTMIAAKKLAEILKAKRREKMWFSMTLPEMICRLPSQMLIVMTDWWSLLLPTTAASSLAWRHSCVNSRQRTSRNVPSAISRTEPGLLALQNRCRLSWAS